MQCSTQSPEPYVRAFFFGWQKNLFTSCFFIIIINTMSTLQHVEMIMEQKLSHSELTQYTTMWCREKGIKPRDLGCGSLITEDGRIKPYQNAHPAIDDVIILIKLREEFWTYWNHNEQCTWSAHWSSVYHKGFPLKAKALKNIERLANTGIFRQEQQAQQRKKIKAIRESK